MAKRENSTPSSAKIDSDVDKVRASRDGDQFHYIWAARRCLRLLSAVDGLCAVAIEGPSPDEGPEGRLAAGEQLIDVAEYYGSQDLRKADRVRFIQLKHSTHRAAKPWAPSELKATISGFAARYDAQVNVARAGGLSFEYISNRPMPDDIIEAVRLLATGEATPPKSVADKLAGYTGLTGDTLRGFFNCLVLENREPDLLAQRALLNRESKDYLLDGDLNAPTLLKELVAWKATTPHAETPTITKLDVLGAWSVQEDRLFPAPSLLAINPQAVPRAQESDIGEAIVSAHTAVIIHAPGGVGKSVLSTRLGARLPDGSQTVVYDCYGGGGYRRRGHSRHRHSEALVQVANELAAKGLCFPLIPKESSDAGSFIRAFGRRLQQASDQLRVTNPTALLCIVFDAVDNAEMAARELDQGRSFAPDLLRENWPDNVRIVMLCRPERRDLLDAPPTILELPLAPFDLAETAVHLRGRFPKARAADVAEFHRLSSQNPRVQANALAVGSSLSDMLRSFGPDPQTVDKTIANQLEAALATMRDETHLDRAGLDRLCTALATLRPLVPLTVLAPVSGLSADSIRSFSADFAGGRPIMLLGDAVQFRDEPVEDWFRKRYRANEKDAAAFLEVLKPLAGESAYVASSLPSLMLEAGQLDALIDMALSDRHLPTAHPTEARDIRVQRVHFALKAALRTGRRAAAVKLALSAAEETAGEARFLELLQTHHDLASVFVGPDSLSDLVVRRRFKGRWLGARHAYEAALLSGAPSLAMDARIQLRMCFEWLRSWADSSDDARQKQPIEFSDIAAMAFAQLNIHGPEAACREIARWIAPETRFKVAAELGATLVDHGRYDEVDALMRMAASLKQGPILGALTAELSRVGRTPPKEAVEAALTLGFGVRAIPRRFNTFGADQSHLGVAATAEAALLLGVGDPAKLAEQLRRRFAKKDDDALGSRYREARGEALRGLSLAAALGNKTLEPADLASPRLKKYLGSGSHHGQDYQDAQRFRRIVGSLLPWYQARADQIIALCRGHRFDVHRAITKARKRSEAERSGYEEPGYDVEEQIAGIWFDILVRAGPAGAKGAKVFQTWSSTKGRALFPRTQIEIARVAARSAHLASLAYVFSRDALVTLAGEATETAEARISSNIDVSRALLALDPAEAEQYFNAATDMSTRVGDDAFSRWEALVTLATTTGSVAIDDPSLAFRFGRCGEFASEHLDRNFSWPEVVSTLVGLSPSEAIATTSRWIDRDVGLPREQLPALVRALTQRELLDPVTACAFFGFRGEWDHPGLLAGALSGQTPLPPAFLDRVLHYIGLDQPGRDDLKALAEALRGQQSAAKRVNTWLAQANEQARVATRRSHSSQHVSTSKPTRRWAPVFRNLDVTTPEGQTQARARASGSEYYGPHSFWEEAVRRVPLGREAMFIESFAALDLGVYYLREFFGALPHAWFGRLAPKAALETLVRRVVRTHWEHFGRKRRWGVLPIDTLMGLTGLSASAVRQLALEGAGEADDIGGADSIFGLVEVLGAELTPAEASECLDFGLSLMEKSLPEGFAEGEWDNRRRTTASPSTLLGGLLWNLLGSPIARVRWQAAHVARSLMVFGSDAVLSGLVESERQGAPAILSSPTFVFYELHARQWLLFAVARAAAEAGPGVNHFTGRLSSLAQRTNPHVVIRAIAADALRYLDETHVRPIGPNDVEALLRINESSLTPIASNYRADPYRDRLEDRKFPLPYEFSRSEMVGLANAFAIPLSDAEAAVDDVVVRCWKLKYQGRRLRDPREDQRQMSSGRRMRGRDGAIHDLTDYRAYHAACIAAGQLLETHPLRETSDEIDPLMDWIQQFLPTSGSSQWISDRRTPAPQFRATSQPDDDWRWSVSRADLEAALMDGSDIRVSADFTQSQGEFEETISIRSALVTDGDPVSLLAAAQTAPDAWAFPMPNSESEGEISERGYGLRGWLSGRHRETHADRDDPWAGDMPCPGPMPSIGAALTLRFRPEDGFKRYRNQRGRVVMRTRLWGSDLNYEGESDGPRGEALSIDRAHLKTWLASIACDMMLCVSSRREVRRYGQGTVRGEDFIEYPNAYFLIVWISADGTIRTL